MSQPSRFQTKDQADESLLTVFTGSLRVGGGIAGTQNNAIMPKARRPHYYAQERMCQFTGCDVRIASYNKGPNCYAHSPQRYPRVRGQKPDN